MRYVVYNGYDNVVVMRLSDRINGIKEYIEIAGASAVRLELPDIPQVITSGLDWSGGNGLLVADIGDQAIPEGTHRVRIVVIDPSHPNGQVVIHEDVHDVSLRVV